MIKHLHIRYKQLAIIALPFIGLLGFAVFRIDANLTDSRAAERSNQATLLADQVSGLVNELQTERDLTAGWLASGRKHGEDAVLRQRAQVDSALRDYREAVDALDRDSYGRRFAGTLRETDEELKQLGEERRKLDEGDAPALTFLIQESYGSKIDCLIEVVGAVPGDRGPGTLDRNLLMLVELAQLKQAVSEQRGLVFGVLSAGSYHAGAERDLLGRLIATEDVVQGRFKASAMVEQQDLVSDVFGQPVAKEVEAKRLQVLRTPIGTRMQATPGSWYKPASGLVSSLRAAEQQIITDVLRESAASKAKADRSLMVCTVTIVVVLLVSVGGALLMSRSMTRSLRRLREGAEDVAERQLPGVVDRVSRLRSGPLELEKVTDASPVKVDSRDEIGQVAEAFNAVHRVAVRVAMEQAALRKSVGDMFLNLARRNQDLIDRQLELIDELERDEEDPERLEELFRVDHLATRMRRNAEDLIILSGNRPARRWDGSIPLADVVRAALAEVENYTRVEITPVARLNVVGESVGDIVHLVAELMENAVQFSPPGENVQVSAHPIAGGHVIEITDRGCGMSDEELADANCRLSNASRIDLALSERLGLHVVAQLASRHDVTVTLRRSWYGGITASVVLPNDVLEVPESLTDPDLARHHAAAGMTTDEPLAIFEQARSEWFERRAEARAPAPAPAGPPAVEPSQPGRLPPHTRPEVPQRQPAVVRREPAAAPVRKRRPGGADDTMPRFAEDISPEVVDDDLDWAFAMAPGKPPSRPASPPADEPADPAGRRAARPAPERNGAGVPGGVDEPDPEEWTPTRPPGVRLGGGRPAPPPRNGRLAAPGSPTRPPGIAPAARPAQKDPRRAQPANGNGHGNGNGNGWVKPEAAPRTLAPPPQQAAPAAVPQAPPARPPAEPAIPASRRARPAVGGDARRPTLPGPGGLWDTRERGDEGQARGDDLPQRVPAHSMAPGLAAALVRPAPPPLTATPRDPAEIRRMLSSYRSGLERGRQETTGGSRSGNGNGGGWNGEPGAR